ncbi:MAG: aminotransferase class V-fold PLP-dependent enzyme [Elusimicrobiota bacterium]|jgi:cysteine desulfurase/selenocysteine lyase
MSPSRYDVGAVRRDYPVLRRRVGGKRLVYLDSACTALKPRQTAEALRDFYLSSGGCGGRRSTHRLAREAEAALRAAREEAAVFIGAASPEEIVLTSGTTGAANLLARAFPYTAKRREVVVTELEHNSVLLPFHALAERGEIRLRVCPAPGGRLDLEALERLVTERTALVAFTRASNVAGGVTPAAEVVRIARRRGAQTFVDDAQYLLTHEEDVRALGADYAAFSAHKLGGPFGFGVLYGRRERLRRLGVAAVGGGTVHSVAGGPRGLRVRWLDAPARLEPGVPDFGGAAAFAAALRVRRALPAAALRAHVAGLVRRLVAGLERFRELRPLGASAELEKGALVSLLPAGAGFSPADFALFLDHELPGRIVSVRAGEHCAHLLHRRLGVDATVRVSFGPYSTTGEVDDFLDALDVFVNS